MKINATFRRKEVDHEAKPCVVEEIIELPANKFAHFMTHLMEYQPFITENAERMKVDMDGVYHCLLVLGEDHDDGILVESEGADYARYSAFIPNARQIVEQDQRYDCIKELEGRLSRIVNDVMTEARPNEDHEYTFNLEDVADSNDVIDIPLLAEMFAERPEIMEMDQDDTEVTLRFPGWGQADAPAGDSAGLANRYRPDEDELELMCAKHFLWLHDQIGGEEADFTDMNLFCHDLMFKRLDGANFYNTVLHDVDMREGSFTGCDFTNADFDSVTAYAAIFDESVFTGAKMKDSNFQRASMTDCHFDNADFGNTEFNKAVLDNSDLTGTSMEFANFTQTRLDNCIGLSDADEPEEFGGMNLQ